MAEPVEVAIEAALLARAQAFATAQGLTISLPNVEFTPPTETPAAKYLRAYFLPAPSFETGISYDAHIQHYGLMQIDVVYGQGAGEYAPSRISSSIIQYFKRGTRLSKDGFTIKVTKAPFRGSLQRDKDTAQSSTSTPWVFIPVSIPYLCFARPA